MVSLLSIVSTQFYVVPEVKASTICPVANSSEDLETINYWTQYFFALLRPELRAKPDPDSSLIYRKEKAAIQQVINYVLFCSFQKPDENKFYLLTKTKLGNNLVQSPRNRYFYHREDLGEYEYETKYFLRGDYYQWQPTTDYFFEGLYQDLTDAIFYARHPEISPQKERMKQMEWNAEWIFIRLHFANYDQEQILRENFIPVCHALRQDC